MDPTHFFFFFFAIEMAMRMALEDQDGLGRSLEMDDGGRGLARGVLLYKISKKE